ncbi:Carbonic anhydrase [Rhodovulum sp. PH10]|uniref:carbonic anhydrase n=1 Tax=Rhodovulum sp. PH10 TaxID=1187851 RepID=UPI00027C2745|nr:carbonic anhydrase [Rhodovulum sp. PH10]EJW12999.1 Carbonic anhydrase [Rhodovulum sp. PH10]
MKLDRRHTLKALAGLALCPLCAGIARADEGVHWGYDGDHGPAHWGELDKASNVCGAGAQQSPIDIGPTIRAELPELKIDWSKGVEKIVNNGHTIQVNVKPGSTLELGDQTYQLLQFHFHRPSEHTVAGKHFPMEVHFVHKNDAGLAVVGVLMETGDKNPLFAEVIDEMPREAGKSAALDGDLHPEDLLPKARSYYRYTGSLTTPPCSETVEWLLMTEPVEVASSDVDAFAKLYAMNARPVQKPHRRFVLRSG